MLQQKSILWKMLPDNKLKKKGNDENHSQFQFIFSFVI